MTQYACVPAKTLLDYLQQHLIQGRDIEYELELVLTLLFELVHAVPIGMRPEIWVEQHLHQVPATLNPSGYDKSLIEHIYSIIPLGVLHQVLEKDPTELYGRLTLALCSLHELLRLCGYNRAMMTQEDGLSKMPGSWIYRADFEKIYEDNLIVHGYNSAT